MEGGPRREVSKRKKHGSKRNAPREEESEGESKVGKEEDSKGEREKERHQVQSMRNELFVKCIR